MSNATKSTPTGRSALLRSPKFFGFVFVALACLCWGSASILVKVVISAGVAPFDLAGIRTFMGAVFGLAVVGLIWPRLMLIKKRDLLYVAIYGVLAWGVGSGFGFLSLEFNPVAVASLLLYTSPIFTLVWSACFARDGVRRYEVVAGLVVLMGAALVARVYEPDLGLVHWLGILVGLGAGMGFAFTTIFGKFAVGRLNPWTILVYGMGFAAIFWLFTGTPMDFVAQRPPLWVWGAAAGIAFLSGLPSIGLYLVAMRTISSAEANVSATLEPVFAILLAFAILSERLEPLQLLGAAVLLGGVIYLQASGIRARSKVPATASAAN